MDKKIAPSCCATDDGHDHGRKFDYIFWGCGFVIIASILLYCAGAELPGLHHFAIACIKLLEQMWWGVLIGILFVGLMSKIPREYFQVLMGRGDSFGGILRAVVAGVFLDLCSHGILLIAAKLYERGVSLAQIMAFLIASPWNSFSLTIILVSLIGLPWTIIFIIASCMVAMITGFAYLALVKSGTLPENPNTITIPHDFSLIADAKKRLKNFRLSLSFFTGIIKSGLQEGQMLIRWLLLGVVIAAAINAFLPADIFNAWFGPTVIGLAVTLVAATVIEVCSEGSVPIASLIFNQAHAAGNAFVFLMAGVSTDYTEILIIRQMTKSWKIAFSLPLVTVPQILLIGYFLNILQ